MIDQDHLVFISPNCDRFQEGTIRPLINVPAVECPRCGIGMGMRRLDVPCPPDIRSWIESRKRPITPGELSSLNRIWRTHSTNFDLNPGDIFTPLDWARVNAPNAPIYWPQFSNFVSDWETFSMVKKVCYTMAVSPIEIKSGNARYVEWRFENHSISRASCFDGNRISACDICHSPKQEFSLEYQVEVSEQFKGRWLYSDHCFSSDFFLSHIFYPGFLARPHAVEVMKDRLLPKSCLERIEIRHRAC